MFINKIVLSTVTSDKITSDAASQLQKNLGVFAEYKRKEADFKAAETAAKQAREDVIKVLQELTSELKETQDFEVTVEGEKEIFLVTSKASKTTFLTTDDVEEKIEKTVAELAELQETKTLVSSGGHVIKSAPRITFNIKKI